MYMYLKKCMEMNKFSSVFNGLLGIASSYISEHTWKNSKSDQRRSSGPERACK